jgi:hypothetical protein
LVIIGSTYTASLLPFVTENLFYKDYILAYMPFIRRGFSVLMIIFSAYIASISLNLILTKSSVSIIR